MPGDSGWTFDTLKHHIDQQLSDLRTQMDERQVAQRRAIEAAFAAQTKAMETAFIAANTAISAARETARDALIKSESILNREFHEHLEQVRHENTLALDNVEKRFALTIETSDRAITKAELATERRFEGVNEFRAQLSDQASRFMPRAESLSKYDATQEKLNELADRSRLSIADLTTRLDRIQGSDDGTNLTKSNAYAILGGLVGVMTIIILAINLAINLTIGA